MRAIPPRLWVLAALSGLLQALAFPLGGPVPPWRRAFCWMCLVPLLAAVGMLLRFRPQSRIRHAAALGYLCGFVWYALNCYWIEATMHLYGGLPTAAAWGVLVLFSLYLGLYEALFAAVLFILLRRYSYRTAWLLAPTLWVAVELARARVTGFPWDLLGYAQGSNFLLNRLAPVTGVMGISLVIAAINSLWLVAWKANNSSRARLIRLGYVALGALLLTVESIPMTPPPDSGDQTAVLLQDDLNINAGLNQPETHSQMLNSFVHLSLQPDKVQSSGAPVVILWPEAPNDFLDSDPQFRSPLLSLADTAHATVIAEDVSQAPPEADGTRHVYNSARLVSPDGSSARYDKMHLVPFGEYTPYKPLFFFAGHLLDDLPFVPGLTRHDLASGGHTYGVFLCYESIFGDEVRQFTLHGAQVLVNLSDDGWYGDSSAPWEHLDMARMRALENDRWLLRDTNTGVTASIDPHGRIVAVLPRHVRSSLAAPFAFRDHLTFYARWGDWIAWLCAGIVLAVLLHSIMIVRKVH